MTSRIVFSTLLLLLLSFAGTALAQASGYELTYTPQRRGAEAMFKVVAPEGATCEVVGDLGDMASKEVPFAMKAKGDMYYSFTCKLPSGAIWKKKLEAKPRELGTLRLIDDVTGATTVTAAVPGAEARVTVVTTTSTPNVVAPTVVAPTVVAPMVVAKPNAISATTFASLKQTIKAGSFADDQLSALRSAAAHNWFTIAQVGEVVDLFTFGDDKIKAVRVLKPRVIDPENAFMLQNHFTFGDDKRKVMKIFK